MKILHTISNLGISAGGPSSCTYNLLKGLQSTGIGVDILTINIKQDQIIGLDSFVKAVEDDSKTFFMYSRNFKKSLSLSEKYDLYHANGLWTYPTHATAHHALRHKKPYVIAPHGMLYSNALQISGWKKKIALTLFQQKDLERAICLQATSHAEVEHIRNFGLTNPIALIPNCLKMDDEIIVRERENKLKRFGFVGRLNRIKKIDVLLQAWLKLGKLTSQSELMIVGSDDFNYERELQQYVIDNKMNNVFFQGFLNGEILKKAILSLDYLVLPSQSENFGMVVLEALTYSVPVIASKGTPWEELDTHNCGWWVDNDIDTIAETIRKAIETPERTRLEMGKRGQKLVKNNYSVEIVTKKMTRLYDWILNGGESPTFIM